VQYKAREPDQDTATLIGELEPIVSGLGFALIETSLYRSGKGNGKAQVRLVVGKSCSSAVEKQGSPGTPGSSGIGTDELSQVHRAIVPRLELALEGRDLYLEVSSPGTDRLIKEGAEFRHYTGKNVKCWRVGADRWEHGLLRGSDKEKILFETGEGITELTYEKIAKARLDG